VNDSIAMTGVATACRSCGASDLVPFLSLGRMPLVDAFVREEDRAEPDPRFPLGVALCPSCSLVQILETVPPETLFVENYHYFSSFSDALLDHARRNVESLIASRGLGAESLVIELASNDGYLLQFFRDRGIPVLGIDPSPGPAEAAIAKGIPTLREFFGVELAWRLRREGRRADVIIANNVLAHVPDLNGFVAGIGILLADDGVAAIEAPYLKDLIDRCEFDTIYHEHHSYFSVTALSALFRRHGLSLNRLEHHPIHGGSLRIFVERRENTSPIVREYLAREEADGLARPAYYRDFAARVASVRDDLLRLLRGIRARGGRIAAYGAAAKGSVLLNYAGIGTDLIEFVADRNIHKQWRYMPGVRIPIRAPEEILREMPAYVLLLAWNFKDEILRQQAAYRERGGRFIVPIPRPEII